MFYKDRFLCRAISAELAGKTDPFRDILRVRNGQRKQWRKVLEEQQNTVDFLLQLKRGKSLSKPAQVQPQIPHPVSASSAYRTSEAGVPNS